MVVVGLSFTVYSANELVKYAGEIAYQLDVPHAIVGSTMSGLGTSLPELTVAMAVARKSQGKIGLDAQISPTHCYPLNEVCFPNFTNRCIV